MKTITILSIFILSTIYALGQSNADYNNAVKRYMTANGGFENFKTVISQMIQVHKNNRPNYEDEFWVFIEREINDGAIEILVDMVAPIYKKYLTQKDLEEIIEFYESPVGKKLAVSTPHITSEIMTEDKNGGQNLMK